MSPNPALVATVRAVATDVGGRADFDWDAIADLRMAVDEACATLIELADPAASVSCVFTVDRDHIHVRACARAARADTSIDTNGFGWQILSMLVDELHAGPAPSTDRQAEGEHHELVISLTKTSG